jgi:hypothetical protein
MYINLKRLKAPEVRKLAKTYNKLNLIPHPSILKKADLIKYLKEKLETNKKGAVFVDHPKLKKSIQPAIDRIFKEDEEARLNLEQTMNQIEKEIKTKISAIKEREKDVPRLKLTKEQKADEERRLKHLIETGKVLYEPVETPKTKKEIEEQKKLEELAQKYREEAKLKQEKERSKRNQEIMKKVKEELKAKEKKKKPKPPTKKKEVKEEVEDEVEEDPETLRMAEELAKIKDPEERKRRANQIIFERIKKIRQSKK